VKGQKNEILTRPKSRHSSRPDVFYFFAHRTFFKTIADPLCTHCQSPTSQRCDQSFVKECNLADTQDDSNSTIFDTLETK